MPVKNQPKSGRPAFLDRLNEAYGFRRKNLVVLTGDTYGLFWSPARQAFVSLEQLVFAELGSKFNAVRMDIASGLSFPDKRTEAEVFRVCESKDGVFIPSHRIKSLRRMLESSTHNPLQALVLLQGIGEAFQRVRSLEPELRPLCAVLQFSGALFPTGNFDRLSELDRQRLVYFLNWMSGPDFQGSPELVLLVNHTKAEINPKILALPNVAHLEISLPTRAERAHFVDHFVKNHTTPRIAGGRKAFVEDTAGLTLSDLDDLLRVAEATGKRITRDQVVGEVNRIVQTQLGEIVRVKYPTQTRADIIGNHETTRIFGELFQRCEDVETAVPAFIVSGPNGSGKTFQLECFAADSGRVVIELSGIRGSYFGETDRFFELLRWHLLTLGKILILVDEAHTAFGSIHGGSTHQTEKRLAGNVIKMMSDSRFFGKVVWGLMTSRPDLLDPDIKSRAPVQVPIFDPEGEVRQAFLAEMLDRKNIAVPESQWPDLMARTAYYSARDYRNLTTEILAQRRHRPELTPLDVLSGWSASRSITKQRELQSLIAARHCSYPALLPERYRSLGDAEMVQRIEAMRHLH
ncbi:AAA family ATPase [Sulfidibacter corallicola]|uniref:AAA family ATPase n=1 Tax=Sulfidibacter corallicola TaxID=2818388 RepID=A0A8A4TS08_SULCO|nr:ATP-binding protein [Sulfidibacter corallicola]QTD51852.1 AAA family ATPase [Sulfidibacter corallicola]